MTSGGRLAAIELEFVSQGVPTLISGYSLFRHVLPRALGFLSAAGLSIVAVTAGSSNGVVLLTAVAMALAVWLAMRRLRGSQNRRISAAGRRAMAAAWVTWPFLAPALTVWIQGPERLELFMGPEEGYDWVMFLYENPHMASPDVIAAEAAIATGTLIIWWAVITAVALAVTYFGILPLVGRALRELPSNLGALVRVQVKALPAMVFLTLFLFVNADVWQASASLNPQRIATIMGLFAAVALGAAYGQFREEARRLVPVKPSGLLIVTDFESASPAPEIADDNPLGLTFRQRLNVRVALGVRHLARSLWIGLGLFAFLAFLGTAIGTEQTATRWLGDGYESISPWHVPVAMLVAALLLSGFAATYFAVTSMNDETTRTVVFGPTVKGLEDLLSGYRSYASAGATSNDRVTTGPAEAVFLREGSRTANRVGEIVAGIARQVFGSPKTR